MTMPDEVPGGAKGQDEPTAFRTSITMPVDLGAYAKSRAPGGNMSAYLSGLVAEEQRRELVWQRLADHGYVGDLAPTEEGRLRARAVLTRHRAKKTRGGGTGQKAA
jgi:hypothetical protein